MNKNELVCECKRGGGGERKKAEGELEKGQKSTKVRPNIQGNKNITTNPKRQTNMNVKTKRQKNTSHSEYTGKKNTRDGTKHVTFTLKRQRTKVKLQRIHSQ